MKILVVEDEKLLREAVLSFLTADGFTATGVDNGDEGLFGAEQLIYDLIILDVMLPGINGLEILQKLRGRHNDTPVLLLTAKDRIEDRVAGLDAGADDYLIKPFAAAELLARVRALLRRKTSESLSELLSYKKIAISTKTKEVRCGDHILNLTAKEYELLEFLLLNRERILTKEQIFDRLWGLESETGSGIVDVYIHYLRKKLETVQSERMIHTIRGVGYMLKDKDHE